MTVPIGVQSTQITGRFIHGALDGKDVDREPDGVPWVGLTITFNATIARVRNVRTDPPSFVTLDPIVVRTDSEGLMVSPDSEPSVFLIACDDPMLLAETSWYWVATITGGGYPTERIPFYAKANTTFDLVRDSVTPLDVPTAIAEWLRLRNEVQAMINGFNGTATIALG